MRLARKLALLTAMALTAMALTASTANAAGSIEVIEEGGAHCNFATGSCNVHAIGDSELIAHTIFGPITVSQCQDEFFAHIGENGTGHIYEYENNHVDMPNDCTRINCAASPTGENEWPIVAAEEDAANEGEMLVEFCLEAEGGAQHHCEVDVHVEEDPQDPHHYIFTVDDICIIAEEDNLELEVIGQWETEQVPGMGEDNIEIEHL